MRDSGGGRLGDTRWTPVMTELSSTEDHRVGTHTFLISWEGFNFLWVHGPPPDCHWSLYIYWSVCVCVCPHMHSAPGDEALLLLMGLRPKAGVWVTWTQTHTCAHRLHEVSATLPQRVARSRCDGELFLTPGDPIKASQPWFHFVSPSACLGFRGCFCLCTQIYN